MTALQRLADHVWLFPHDPDRYKVQASVGVICDKTQTVLIDSGNGASHADRVREALQAIDAPPVSRIIYTHHHWDHTFGAYRWGVPAVGHVLCQEHLGEDAAKPWGPDYIDAQIGQEPRYAVSYRAMKQATSDWRSFRIVVPEVTFTENLTVPLDSLTLELSHVGGHTPDSIVVRVKEARVIFLGDCFYPGAEDRRIQWKLLSAILADSSVDMFVSSHMKPVSRREHLKFWVIYATVQVMSWRRELADNKKVSKES